MASSEIAKTQPRGPSARPWTVGETPKTPARKCSQPRIILELCGWGGGMESLTARSRGGKQGLGGNNWIAALEHRGDGRKPPSPDHLGGVCRADASERERRARRCLRQLREPLRAERRSGIGRLRARREDGADQGQIRTDRFEGFYPIVHRGADPGPGEQMSPNILDIDSAGGKVEMGAEQESHVQPSGIGRAHV